jgi:hypothetical protein
MDLAPDGFTTANPELRLCPSTEASVTMAAGFFGRHLEDEIISERGQNLQVKALGAHEIRNG